MMEYRQRRRSKADRSPGGSDLGRADYTTAFELLIGIPSCQGTLL